MSDNVKIYPVPDGEILTDDFEMTADGRAVPLHYARVSAYPINRRWPGHQRPLAQTEIASFASFGVSGPCRVCLKPKRTFHAVIVRPLSRGIVPETGDGGVISFTLPGAGQYTVELDGMHCALHIFADEIRDYGIDIQAPDVLYYGPGIHDAGLIELYENQTLFIDEGAIVFARVSARDAPGIRILGHGILDGSRCREVYLHEFGEEDRKRMESGFAVLNAERFNTIDLMFCDDAVIDGIIIRDSLLYTIRPTCCRNLSIHNVKIIGNWRYNSDGIDMHNCRHVRIDSCFIRTFDDCICIKGFDYVLDPADMTHNGIDYNIFCDAVIERCVVWCDWNTALEFGAETRADEIFGITFRDCDVIHCSVAACDITGVDYAVIHDVLYENIRIEETPVQRMILQKEEGQTFSDEENPPVAGCAIRCCSFHHPEYSCSDPRLTVIRDVTFRNISVTGRAMMPSYFSGGSEDFISGPIRIENLTFNGRKLNTPEEALIQTDGFFKDVTLS